MRLPRLGAHRSQAGPPTPPGTLPPEEPPSLEAQEVSLIHGRSTVLRGVNLRVEPGETLAVVGPNGSGKTSLLRIMAGIAAPSGGRALLGGRDLRTIADRRRARIVACVAQEERTDLPFTAREVLLLGRGASMSDWRPYRIQDHRAIEELASHWGLSGLLERSLQEMSGGERRRVLLARAFAQRTGALVLDEPTNHLDLRHQHELLEQVARRPTTALLALHDLDLAAAYCDRVALLNRGRLVAQGPPGQVLVDQTVEEVYDCGPGGSMSEAGRASWWGPEPATGVSAAPPAGGSRRLLPIRQPGAATKAGYSDEFKARSVESMALVRRGRSAAGLLRPTTIPPLRHTTSPASAN